MTDTHPANKNGERKTSEADEQDAVVNRSVASDSLEGAVASGVTESGHTAK